MRNACSLRCCKSIGPKLDRSPVLVRLKASVKHIMKFHDLSSNWSESGLLIQSIRITQSLHMRQSQQPQHLHNSRTAVEHWKKLPWFGSWIPNNLSNLRTIVVVKAVDVVHDTCPASGDDPRIPFQLDRSTRGSAWVCRKRMEKGSITTNICEGFQPAVIAMSGVWVNRISFGRVFIF